MNNMLNYIQWRGDLSFTQSPLCPIDFLIFSEIVHAPLESIDTSGFQPLGKLAEQLLPPQPHESALIRSRHAIWEMMSSRRRFADVHLTAFTDHFSEIYERQFAAALLDVDGVGVVAFRGTDATITGWKEDFNMAFEEPVPAQTDAVQFLCMAALRYSELYVCGHSKGGNLAVYSAAVCPGVVRNKILACYTFDGPGMNTKVLTSEGFRNISGRIRAYIPESSIIGELLGRDEAAKIVRSDSVGILQHNPFNWHVDCTDFVEADSKTLSSGIINRALYTFLNDCSNQQRRVMVDTLCDLLDASGAGKLGEVPLGLLTHPDRVYAVLSKLTPSEKRDLSEMLRLITASGGAGMQSSMYSVIARLTGNA